LKSSAGKVELGKFSWEGWDGKVGPGNVGPGNLVGKVELGRFSWEGWDGKCLGKPWKIDASANGVKAPQWFESPMIAKNHGFSGSVQESSGKPEP
jgi:hypothetical protein